MDALHKAIDLLGTQASIAELCGLSPQAVSQWVAGVRPIPPRHARTIEKATGGVVTARQLRPDLAEFFAASRAS